MVVGREAALQQVPVNNVALTVSIEVVAPISPFLAEELRQTREALDRMHGSFNDAIQEFQVVPPLIAGVAKLQNVGSEARSTISTKSNEIDEMNAQIRANIAEAANGGGGGGAAAEESHDEVAALVTQRESLVAQQLSRIADATLELDGAGERWPTWSATWLRNWKHLGCRAVVAAVSTTNLPWCRVAVVVVVKRP